MNNINLNLIPFRIVNFELKDERVVLLLPKFQSKILLKIFPGLKNLFFKVKLDPLASKVWQLIDDKSNLSLLLENVKNSIADNNIEERTLKFIFQLYHHKFIILKEGL